MFEYHPNNILQTNLESWGVIPDKQLCSVCTSAIMSDHKSSGKGFFYKPSATVKTALHCYALALSRVGPSPKNQLGTEFVRLFQTVVPGVNLPSSNRSVDKLNNILQQVFT